MSTLKGLRSLANILSGSRERPLIPFDDMVRMIEKSPTIDPVRKGKWIKISPAGIYECSECGQNVMTSDIDVYQWCHGCGAKMEEGEE